MGYSNPYNSEDIHEPEIVYQKLSLDKRVRSRVSWFFLIAGLSLVNSLFTLMGSEYTFVGGLGLTQFVDGFARGFSESLVQLQTAIRITGFIIDLLILGVFVLIGYLGLKRKLAAVITGMALYVADAMILIFFREYYSAVIHFLVLVVLCSGLKSLAELNRLEEIDGSESIDSIRQRYKGIQVKTKPHNTRTQWIFWGIILLILLGLLVFARVIPGKLLGY